MEGSIHTDSLTHSTGLFKSSGSLTSSQMSDGDDQELVDGFDTLKPDYEALEILGEGSYGIVARGVSRTKACGEENAPVAIKKISSVFKENVLLAKRTLREISLLRRLKHRNVISILDFFERQGQFFLVTQLMDTDLEQVIQSDQPLKRAHVMHFIFQILRGVQYLHQRGILHRDLKPANILINEDCSIRVADLGLARLMEEKEEEEKSNMTE